MHSNAISLIIVVRVAVVQVHVPSIVGIVGLSSRRPIIVVSIGQIILPLQDCFNSIPALTGYESFGLMPRFCERTRRAGPQWIFLLSLQATLKIKPASSRQF
jgi:hypothetical protein